MPFIAIIVKKIVPKTQIGYLSRTKASYYAKFVL